jgi:hypothetical protein
LVGSDEVKCQTHPRKRRNTLSPFRGATAPFPFPAPPRHDWCRFRAPGRQKEATLLHVKNSANLGTQELETFKDIVKKLVTEPVMIDGEGTLEENVCINIGMNRKLSSLVDPYYPRPLCDIPDWPLCDIPD